jgi:hypothetical protein
MKGHNSIGSAREAAHQFSAKPVLSGKDMKETGLSK